MTHCKLLPYSFHPYSNAINALAVLSLWYFPYSRERFPLETTVSCAARTFLWNPAVVSWTPIYFTIFQAKITYRAKQRTAKANPLLLPKAVSDSVSKNLKLRAYTVLS